MNSKTLDPRIEILRPVNLAIVFVTVAVAGILAKPSGLDWLWIVVAAVAASFAAGIAYAQFPIMDRVADKVIQKYQTSSCEQLWQQKSQPKSEEEQRVIGFLQGDPQMRQAFFNKVSGPIVNKMFECGMIP